MLRFPTPNRAMLPLLAAFVALVVALPAWGQVTTGSIKVAVIDDSDFEMAIPGATVTLSGESLIGGDQTREADPNGEVAFAKLLPGIYVLDVTKDGFTGVRVTEVQVTVNRVAQIPVTLSAGDMEIIEVEAKKAAVDVNSTSRGEVLTKEFLERIPAGRSYQAAVSMAQGVTGGGGNPNIGGGSYNENTYMLDGANITDPVTGTFSVNFNFDAIQQIEVLLGGYMPEYGVSVGGVVNLVTESGTNNLEFDTSAYYSNGDWRPRMDSRFASDGTEIAPTGFDSTLQSLQISGKVSGPLVRDRAWFIISYQHSRSIAANTGIPQTRDYDGHYVLSKLTVQPSAEHRFTAFMQMDPTTIDNVDQGDPFQKAESQGRQVQGGYVTQGRWQWFLSPDVNIDTMFVVQKSFIEVNGVPCTHDRGLGYHPCKPDEPENDVDWFTPGRVGLFGSYNSVNYTSFYFDDRIRYNASTKLQVLSVKDPMGGTHDFKFGVEGVQLVWDQIQGYAGNLLTVDINQVFFNPETFTNYYWLEITGPIKFRTTGSQFNFFAQDSWKPVKNVTINYGTRFDNFVMRNDLGEPVLNGALLGPRLFGAWDPFGDQKTKVATGYGRFNDTGRLGVASFTSANNYGSKLFLGELFAEEDDGAGFVSATNEMYDLDPSVNYNRRNDKLRTPRVDEILLTLERELVEDVAVFSNMSGKFSRYMFEPDDTNTIYDSDGSAVIGSRIANPLQTRFRLRTPALAKRDYFQWDMGVRKVASRRWGGQVGYTFTRSVGSSSTALSGSFANDPQTQFNYGLLNTDLTHVVKGYGFWDLPTDPWTQRLGLFFQYYSGFPFERRYLNESAAGGGSFGLRIRPRGTYYRANSVWDLALRFQQDIDVRKGKLKIDVQAQNLLNNRAPDNYYAGPLYSDNRLSVLNRQNPLTLQLGLRYEF
jgi:hypothetical protein